MAAGLTAASGLRGFPVGGSLLAAGLGGGGVGVTGRGWGVVAAGPGAVSGVRVTVSQQPGLGQCLVPEGGGSLWVGVSRLRGRPGGGALVTRSRLPGPQPRPPGVP